MLSQSAAGEKPRIVILGGQPGAGKTALSEMVVQIIFETSLVTVINGDDYRDIHPRLCDIVRENEKLLAYFTNERGADGIFTAPPTGHDAASAIEINRNNITQEMRDSINALKKYIFDKMRKRGADADEIKETERILDC